MLCSRADRRLGVSKAGLAVEPGEIDLVRWTRGLNGKALPGVAPEPGQDADEADPLNAFGDHAQTKGMAEVDDRADDVLMPFARLTELEARGELAIQFDLADCQIAQV